MGPRRRSLPREQRRVLASGLPRRLFTVVGGLLLLACSPTVDWTPGPEETSTEFLATEVEEALAALDQAQEAVSSDPEAAAESLARVRSPLVRLREYYLPLLETRARARNALRWYRLGESDRVLEELEAIESIVLAVGERQDAQLSREFDAPLEMVVDARAAVRAGRVEAGDLIERLAARANLMLLKGGLILTGSALEAED